VPAWELAEKDERVMLRIFEGLVERAALFSAVNMGAAMVLDRTEGAAPICVNANGSTFHRTPGLAAKTEVFMRELLEPFGREFRVVRVADAPALGAAMAAF
jgi:hexokinase